MTSLTLGYNLTLNAYACVIRSDAASASFISPFERLNMKEVRRYATLVDKNYEISRFGK